MHPPTPTLERITASASSRVSLGHKSAKTEILSYLNLDPVPIRVNLHYVGVYVFLLAVYYRVNYYITAATCLVG